MSKIVITVQVNVIASVIFVPIFPDAFEILCKRGPPIPKPVLIDHEHTQDYFCPVQFS